MTAARDGVDRLGTPALGGGSNTPASETMSPPAQHLAVMGAAGAPPTQGHLNDNLRNIGKFFKRDMSGFGRFGGGAKGADEGGK